MDVITVADWSSARRPRASSPTRSLILYDDQN